MKLKKIMKIEHAVLLLIISLFLVSIPRTSTMLNIESTKSPKASAIPSSRVSILVYSEYADKSPDQEFENTLAAIDQYYGYFYDHDNLTDYTNLDSVLSDYDILLIPEQEDASESLLKTIGESWQSSTSEFVSNGGVVICLDHTDGLARTRHILNSSNIMKFGGSVSWATGDRIYLTRTPSALTQDVNNSWIAPSGTVSVSTKDGIIVVEDDNNNPIVVHKHLGEGHIVYCGFDFYDYDFNVLNYFGKILANAIRLTYIPHIAFDASHGNSYDIAGGFRGFAQDLVNMGYDVSNMSTFNGEYLNGSDILVLTYGDNDYTASDVDLIEDYIDEGKGLLVCTQQGSLGDELDNVLTRFGFEREKSDRVIDSDDYTRFLTYPIFSGDNIKTHEITAGIISIEVYLATAFTTLPSEAKVLISTDNDSTSTWQSSGTPAEDLAMAASFEPSDGGRMVMISESDIMQTNHDSDNDGSYNYYDRSNSQFLLNSILWLLEEPSDSSDSSDKSKPSVAITGFPVVFIVVSISVSCAAMLIFIYIRKS